MVADSERPGTVHGLVERQARRAPQAVAVRCGGAELTYGERAHPAVREAAVVEVEPTPGKRLTVGRSVTKSTSNQPR